MKKKIIVLLACGTLAVSFTACGSSDTSETSSGETEDEEQNEDELDESSTEAEEESGNEQGDEAFESEVEDPAVGCLEDLSEGIGSMTYDEVIEYMDGSGLVYESTEPTEDDIGTITTEEDGNGCHLYIAFFPDDDDIDTICVISYGNDHFSGSVSDNMHMDEITYTTYDIYDDEPNTEVGSLQDVIDYINDDIPVLITEDNEKPDGEPIEVTFSVTEETSSEGTVFTIDTNLPDETNLSVSLRGDGYTGQTSIAVENGKAVTEAFSDQGAPLEGTYELSVTSVYPASQPDSVKEIIGVDGENLTGEYVTEGTGGGYTASATFDFTF